MLRQALGAARRASRAQAALTRISVQGSASKLVEQASLTSASGRSFEALRFQITRSRGHVSTSSSLGALYGSMLVERIPVVLPDPPQWEVEYHEWSESRRDRHRVKLPDQIVEPKGLLENLPDFEPAPRETEADRTGDRKTLQRKLSEYLFLVLKDKNGKWGFPKTEHAQSETMRQTAERSLKDFAGESIECWVVGNAPQGHYEEQDGTTFYYRGSYLEGDLVLQGGYTDHAWVTKEELGEFFDAQHHDLLKRML